MLITRANIVLWAPAPRILSDHAVLISGERIEKIGPTSRLERDYLKTKRLDEAEVRDRARELAKKAWKRCEEQLRA